MEFPKSADSLVERGVKRVGDYLIERELGRGTFARVFKCHSALTTRAFAIKVIPIIKLTTPHAKRLLKTEVSVMNTVNHPNVMHLHDFLKSQQNYYLVLDYCQGGDLLNYIRSRPRGYIEELAAIPLFKQIMNGFAELRKHAVIHRDIKSENIFLREKTLVIGDFGLAHAGAETASSYVGSRQFMAPEVLAGALNGSAYDSRVDLWSIGCMFYEMLFGEAPFRFKDATQMLAEIAQKSGERLNFPRDISLKAKDLLCRLLHPDPHLRLDWRGFFNHPLFQKVEAGIDLTELPLIDNIHAWAEERQRIEGDFEFNCQADFDLAVSEASESKVSLAKQHVEERYSTGDRLSPRAFYFEEVTLRYLHERNKVWWTSYVNKKLTVATVDAQIAEVASLLGSANSLIALKVELLVSNLLRAIRGGENVFGVKEEVFADYVNSSSFIGLVHMIQKDHQRLKETTTLPTQAYRFHRPVWTGNGSPKSKSEVADLDARIRAVHRGMFTSSQKLIDARPEVARKVAYLLALVRTCYESDAYFPFRRLSTSSGKFDWVKFYEKIENGTFEQLVALAR